MVYVLRILLFTYAPSLKSLNKLTRKYSLLALRRRMKEHEREVPDDNLIINETDTNFTE